MVVTFENNYKYIGLKNIFVIEFHLEPFFNVIVYQLNWI